MPSLLPVPNLDYTDRDFAALRRRLFGLIRSVFPDWTDTSVANFGNLLVEGFAWVGDVIGHTQDEQAREAWWGTLSQRISAIRHGRDIGFSLSTAAAARGPVRLTAPSAVAVAVPVVEGLRLRTRGAASLPFRVTAAATIPVGASYVDVNVEQAELHTEAFAIAGTPNEVFELSALPFLDALNTAWGNSAVRFVADDGTYTQTDTFLGKTPTDRVFTLFVDELDRAHVRVGDGRVGALPQGATATLTYKTGGGLAGNVDVNAELVVEDGVYDGVGNPVSLQARALAKFSGGAERMTVAQAKQLGPASLRTLTRSVTKDDFETNARLVAGVARALMLTRNEDPSVAENTGRLQVVALGTKLASGRVEPAAPTAGVLADVTTMVTVTKPHTLTFAVTVEGPTFKAVTVSTVIYCQPNATFATVAAAVYASLRDFFAATLDDGTPNPDIDFGANLAGAWGLPAEVAWSAVFNVVHGTTGVRKIEDGMAGLLLDGLHADVVLQPRDFPTLGAVEIQDGDTGTVQRYTP